MEENWKRSENELFISLCLKNMLRNRLRNEIVINRQVSSSRSENSRRVVLLRRLRTTSNDSTTKTARATNSNSDVTREESKTTAASYGHSNNKSRFVQSRSSDLNDTVATTATTDDTTAAADTVQATHFDSLVTEISRKRDLVECYYKFEGHAIRYVKGRNRDAGKPNVILIHGFGGNADQWRDNTNYLANEKEFNVYALDLLGYGYSDKPDPTKLEKNSIYNFYTWARQINEFIEKEMITTAEEKSAFLMCNSVGGVAGLQAAIDKPMNVKGLCLINISMRALHVSKQPELLKPVIEAFQTFLRTSTIGPRFFASVARRETVSKILKEAYYDPTTVTDELVDVILKPGFTENASKVFLDFISYSGGPLPEDLLPKVAIENKTPCLMLWGEKDPWEKMDDGRKLYEKYANAGFVVLKDAGHCPMDENPALVNPLMSKFIEEYA